MATSTRDEIGVGPLAIESLATGGQPHSLRGPAHTDSQQAVLTGMFETTLRKTDKDSDLYGDWAGRRRDQAQARALRRARSHHGVRTQRPGQWIRLWLLDLQVRHQVRGHRR
jgi:hypothetical protein